ncbi:hypothetical protein ACIGZJ_23670 [Kitasatospora sp. NPDC052868]|uniref:hypothetical protein n=1 Tax=Kitasatospora sp. NPDC052868 TaxID=3364060 RepID=UPI0037CA91E9
MTTGGGRTRGRAVARLLLLCALLAGLFLMHGSPTSAGGCHEPRPTGAARAAADPHRQHGAPGAQHSASTALDGPHGPDGSDGPRAHGGGLRAAASADSCVATRDRDGAGAPAPAVPALAVGPTAPTALAGPYRRTSDGPRAPPAAGRRLLLQLGVART